MRLSKKELMIVSVFVAMLFVAAGWLFLGRLSKANHGEQTYGTPVAYEGDAAVVNADAFGAKALAAAKAYAKAHGLTIDSTIAVDLMEDGKLQRAAMVAFKGGDHQVYCFADGHCRPPKE